MLITTYMNLSYRTEKVIFYYFFFIQNFYRAERVISQGIRERLTYWVNVFLSIAVNYWAGQWPWMGLRQISRSGVEDGRGDLSDRRVDRKLKSLLRTYMIYIYHRESDK